jgi:Putative MetA-pathway of phenol degradation
MKSKIILSAILAITSLFAGEVVMPIDTDRPDQTESTALLPYHSFQIEAGATYTAGNEWTIPAFLLRLSLLKNFELRLEGDVTKVGSSTSLSPLALGFKSGICEQKKVLPTISILFDVAMPKWASKNSRSDTYVPTIKFLFDHEITDHWGIGYNLGASWDSRVTTVIYTLVSGFDFTEKVGAYLEIFGEAPQYSRGMLQADGGFTFVPIPNLQFDISGGVGLTANAPDYFFGVGISLRIPD